MCLIILSAFIQLDENIFQDVLFKSIIHLYISLIDLTEYDETRERKINMK